MNCLSDEQLAQISLGIADEKQWAMHAKDCEACRSKLIAIQRVTEQLSAAHDKLAASHTAARAQLLERLTNIEAPKRQLTGWNRLVNAFQSLTFGQRVAAGGVSLSTAVAVLMLLFVFANSAGRLSAMERMLKAVRQVTSYSFRMTESFTYGPKDSTEDAASRAGRREDITYWRAPPAADSQWFGDLSTETEMWHVSGDDPSRMRGGERSYDIKEVFPTGKPGIVILYRSRDGGKYYWYAPPLTAHDLPSYTPMAKLRTVREESGEVVRELGTKEIDRKQARGYIATFKDAPPLSDCGEVEVWVDAETDLPPAFSWKKEYDGMVDEFHITDCRWNIELDPKLFVTTPPDGFTDATPPTKEEDLAQIASALRLYSRLSRGHYPRVEKVDAEAIHQEILNLAGFEGAPQEEWKTNPTYSAIQNAEAGLDTVERVLLDKVNTGYYGTTVGPEDADKVLLWWWDLSFGPSANRRFRVFYGDLRTEILPLAEWSKLVPESVAAPFHPEDLEDTN